MMNRESIEEKTNGLFWTREDEMISDLEEMGYEVSYCCGEYVEITSADEDDDDAACLLYLGHANDTMWVERVREF